MDTNSGQVWILRRGAAEAAVRELHFLLEAVGEPDRCQGLCPAQADKAGRNTAKEGRRRGMEFWDPSLTPRERHLSHSKTTTLLAGPRWEDEERRS